MIGALALAPDAIVADIGAGTGYFSVRLADMLPQGRVYAVDIEPDMVRYLAERAKRDKRDNMADVCHHVDDRVDCFRRLRDMLKPGGRVAIIDFLPDAPEGPPKAARIPAERVVAEMKRARFALAQEHRLLPRQHFPVFEPAR